MSSHSLLSNPNTLSNNEEKFTKLRNFRSESASDEYPNISIDGLSSNFTSFYDSNGLSSINHCAFTSSVSMPSLPSAKSSASVFDVFDNRTVPHLHQTPSTTIGSRSHNSNMASPQPACHNPANQQPMETIPEQSCLMPSPLFLQHNSNSFNQNNQFDIINDLAAIFMEDQFSYYSDRDYPFAPKPNDNYCLNVPSIQITDSNCDFQSSFPNAYSNTIYNGIKVTQQPDLSSFYSQQSMPNFTFDNMANMQNLAPPGYDVRFLVGHDSAFESSPANSAKSFPSDTSPSNLNRFPSPNAESLLKPRGYRSQNLSIENALRVGDKLVCPHPNCGKAFARYHNLKSHMIVHSDEKPFKCDKCDLSFRRNHDLRRHARLHLGIKPHCCPKCNKRFCRSDALKRHIRVDACADILPSERSLQYESDQEVISHFTPEYHSNIYHGSQDYKWLNDVIQSSKH